MIQPRKPSSRILFLAGACLSGFAALLYQNYCIHALFMFLPRSSQLVSLSVGGFLAGLGVSALLFGRWVRNDFARARRAIVLMQALILAYAFFACTDIGFIPRALNAVSEVVGRDSALYAPASGLFVFLFLFIPAFALGGAFPIFNGLYARAVEDVTADTGKVYFWDLAGSVAGCLATGFLLIPYLGIHPTVVLAMLSSVALIALTDPHSKKNLARAGALALALLLYEGLVRAPADYDASSAEALPFVRTASERHYFGDILFQKASPYGTITVGRRDGTAALYINMRPMCHDNIATGATEDLTGSLTADNLKPGASALNIGLGCGRTAYALGSHRNVDRLTVAEINPVVVDAHNAVFASAFPLLGTGKAEIRVGDGARLIREGKEKFDAIVLDIEEVDIIYSSPLYTEEYVRMAKARLNPGGVMTVWSFTVNNDFSKVLYNTLRKVFPHVEIVILRRKPEAAVLYASDRPLRLETAEALDTAKIAGIMETRNFLVNTLANPVLQRYYDAKKQFRLPDGYKERYME